MARLIDDTTVVVPARDEAPTIANVVRRSQPFAREVIVVDGHSRDGTVELARQAGARVLIDGGRGKGDAIRTAIPAIATPITVFIDADGSHDPDDIPRLVGPIRCGASDHVSASRLTGGSSELHGGFDEFLRLAGSAFITACINRRFGVRLSDSQNGFRAIRTDVLRSLALAEDSTTIEQEMVMKSVAAGWRVSEVPSHEYCRRYGASHIHLWQAAPAYVWSLGRYLMLPRRVRGSEPWARTTALPARLPQAPRP
jgi:glycosyltransferase involved in cell wall biosynthesis